MSHILLRLSWIIRAGLQAMARTLGALRDRGLEEKTQLDVADALLVGQRPTCLGPHPHFDFTPADRAPLPVLGYGHAAFATYADSRLRRFPIHPEQAFQQ